MLLLFAVRMVRTGIERSYGAHFQSVMTQKTSRLKSSITGVLMAVILQSSAAVALLCAGFASTGLMQFGTGLAIVLGGDLGSALVVSVLSFELDWLIPVLLSVGGWLFIKSEARKWRQMGRILLGIAFILIALQFLRDAMDPIRDSAFLPAIANYLAEDFVTAFIVGAVLAVVMHSSVAAILMCVALVQVDAIPFAAGVSIVLGANMGGAVVPVWLSRQMPARARRITLANLGLRGGWAIVALTAINTLPAGDILQQYGSSFMLIWVHVMFNALLLLLALPWLGPLETLTKHLLPGTAVLNADGTPEQLSALDFENTDQPTLALASMKRELSRMTGLVEGMFAPVMDAYRTGDPALIKSLRTADERVNDCLSGIRDFAANLPLEHYAKAEKRAARDMVDYAIRLESAGDLVAKRFTTLASELHKQGSRFSEQGWKELTTIHEQIIANLKLAGNVLISDDIESARLLSLEKDELKRAERNSRKRHLKRLREGASESIETSDIHLESLMSFREFNSHISAVAYPILYQHGQLLETRLIDSLTDPDRASA